MQVRLAVWRAAAGGGVHRDSDAPAAEIHCNCAAASERWALQCRPGWMYGALPREAVCTENLTPWLRQLPCREAAGLAALLHGPTVFASPFTSLTASLTVAPDGKGGTRLSLSQTLTLLLPAGQPPEQAAGETASWSLAGLFGAETAGACPLATCSTMLVHLPWDSAAHSKPPGGPAGSAPQQAAAQLGVSPPPETVSFQAGAALLGYPLPSGAEAAPLCISQRRGLPYGGNIASGRPALAVHRCICPHSTM